MMQSINYQLSIIHYQLPIKYTNLTSYNEEAPDGQDNPSDRSFSFLTGEPFLQ